jgi:hypothetical protein
MIILVVELMGRAKYKSARTMEFLVNDQNCPYFIEINPRIHVRGGRERAKVVCFFAFAFALLFNLVYLRRGRSLVFIFPNWIFTLIWTKGGLGGGRRWEDLCAPPWGWRNCFMQCHFAPPGCQSESRLAWGGGERHEGRLPHV